MCLAVPGKVLEVLESDDPLQRTGRVSFGGTVREVSRAYVPEAKIGDFVTVHVGFALAVVDEEDARLVFDFLEQQGGAPAGEQAP
jgi:hydrogenase expression/formation protein HypC